ncbi:MAG TPA: SUMF1/EgtB/PvdO family nonheme iron enzyme [Polyangiaceae bacterium]
MATRASTAALTHPGTWLPDGVLMPWNLNLPKPTTLATDGQRIVVGVPNEPESIAASGAVYVFSRSAGLWRLEQRLLPPPVSGRTRFGKAVAISGDLLVVSAGGGAPIVYFWSGTTWDSRVSLDTSCEGDSLAVTEFSLAVGCKGIGVYVYPRSGRTLGPSQEISATTATSPEVFGQALALEQSALVVSAGGLHVYARRGSKWYLQQRLPGSWLVAINGDTLVTETNIYVHDGASWKVQQALPPPPGRWRYSSIAVSDDALFLASDTSARVLVRTPSGWTEQPSIVPDGPGDVGTLVSSGNYAAVARAGTLTLFEARGSQWQPVQTLGLSDGRFAAVDKDGAVLSGRRAAYATWEQSSQEFAAYVFVNVDSRWAPEQRIPLAAPDLPDPGPYGYFPSLALSEEHLLLAPPVVPSTPYLPPAAFVYRQPFWLPDGHLVTKDDDQLAGPVALSQSRAIIRGQNGVYIFRRTDSGWQEETQLRERNSGRRIYGNAVDILGDVALVGAPSGSESVPGAAYVFVRGDEGWTLQAPLVSEGASATFGSSVSLTTDAAFVAAPGERAVAKVHTFVRTGNDWREGLAIVKQDDDPIAMFAASIDASSDQLVVGKIGFFEGPSAYLFRRTGGTWLDGAHVTATFADPMFGASARMSDGKVLLAGLNGLPVVFRPPDSRLEGAECAHAGDCASGACVDGVCCDQACTEPCEACASVLTGSPDGKCSSRRPGTRCGPDPLQCRSATELETAPTCDASGNCLPRSTRCGGGFTCVDEGYCAWSCAAFEEREDSLCADGYFCPMRATSTAGACEPKRAGWSNCNRDENCSSNRCVDHEVSDATRCTDGIVPCMRTECLGALGDVCKIDTDCASGMCRDGVCCNADCQRICEACNRAAPGTPKGICSQAVGLPPRAGSCGQGPCAGQCGSAPDRCDFPRDGNTCEPARCDGNTLITASVCSGGHCSTPEPSPCGTTFTCNEVKAECVRLCQRHEDCTTDARCDRASGICIVAAAKCLEDDRTLQHADGSHEICPGKCSGTTCDNSCVHTDPDCSPGYVCMQNICTKVTEPDASADAHGCACRTAGSLAPASHAGTLAITALLALGALRRTRNGRHALSVYRHRQLALMTSMSVNACEVVGGYQDFSLESPDVLCANATEPSTRGSAVRLVRAGARCFWMDQTEVTRAQYAEFLASAPPVLNQAACFGNVYTPAPFDAAEGEPCEPRPGVQVTLEDSHPIVCVDWCDAAGYCAWAGKALCRDDYFGAAALGISDWYAACTNDGTTDYPFDEYSAGICNGADNPTNGCQERACTLHAVATLKSCVNGTGIYDLAGNVAEWTSACEDARDRRSECRIRGGSMQSDKNELLCRRLSTTRRDVRSPTTGFRCCAYP